MVWRHVTAIIEVGWAEARPTRRDDARLLDSVSQYLSIEFAAAISTIRTERAQRLDRAAQKLSEVLEDGPDVGEGALSRVRETLASELGVEVAPVTTEPFEDTCVASVPGVGDVELPRPLGELTRGYADAGVAVAPIGRGSALATWLAHAGKPCTGALIDLGEIAGRRRVFLVMRAADEEPVDVEELDFLRRVCIVEDSEGEIIELVNPEIVKAEGEQTGLEGCLSLPGRWGIVTRPYTVRVRAQDRDGATFEVEDEDITARCFCHEIEHLDGHLFSEHCDRLLTDEELEQYLKEHEDEYEREDDE